MLVVTRAERRRGYARQESPFITGLPNERPSPSRVPDSIAPAARPDDGRARRHSGAWRVSTATGRVAAPRPDLLRRRPARDRRDPAVERRGADVADRRSARSPRPACSRRSATPSTPPPTPACDPDRTICPVSSEVDDHRGVIAGQRALAGVAVDDAPLDAIGDGLRGQHEIDAHAATLVEVATAVVPPRVHRAMPSDGSAHDVVEAAADDVGEGVALGLARVGGADERLGVVHVDVGRGDVEVAGDDHRIARPGDRVDVLAEAGEPAELVLVVVAVERPAVRHVHVRRR